MTERRIVVLAQVEIPVIVEMESEDDDLLGSGTALAAAQDALGDTGSTVGSVERWSFDD